MRLNSYLLKSSLVGALGGLLFGFDTAVIAGTTQDLTATFHLTPSQLGITVSIALWGTVVGALTSGILGERMGGRGALRVMALLYVVSSLGCALSWSWSALLVFRFIGGLGIGGSSVLGPVYIAELAPARWRGRLVGAFQINIVIGILLAYLSNYLISRLSLGAAEWRWELGVAAIPAVLFGLLLLSIPSSSRWLVTQKRTDEARQVLEMLGSEAPQRELDEIVASVHTSLAVRNEPVFRMRYIVPLLLAISLGLFNQLSGINAILYYLNDIFSAAGFSRLSSNAQAVAIGLTNLVATLLGMLLIDKLGRKTLLLIGSVGTAACLFGVANLFRNHQSSSSLLWLLVGFILFFAISQGAVIWVYISEIFPTRVRAKGQGVGSSAHWISNAIISGVFPYVASQSRSAPFYFFGAMMVLQFVVVFFFYPETKGKSLEQIQAQFGIE